MDVQVSGDIRPVEAWAPALAMGLGGFSIAVGLLELIAPRTLARKLGMENSETLVALYGLRELGAGIGILASDDKTAWLRARVAGDVLDIGTLAIGLAPGYRRKGNVLLALGAVLGVTALDVLCAQSLSGMRRVRRRTVRDYSDRSGMPRPADEMRGTARDFKVPRDMRIPELLRPYTAC